MALTEPFYRTDYVGESINRMVDDQTISYFVKPRENAFTKSNVETAIVLGNGLTKNYEEVQKILNINSKKPAEGYKLVYACNRAIQDTTQYDYYILKHRVFLSGVEYNKLAQIYLPNDIFLDYKDNTNLIPYVSYFDSGATAAYLSCFDGHKKVFLLGIDGDLGHGYQTVYDGHFPYNAGHDSVDWRKWEDYMYNVMNTYKDVQFYRLLLDGQTAPESWRRLPNFSDVTMRQMVLLGDF